MNNKSRSFGKSVARMAITFGGSYLGGKIMGWVFDKFIDQRSK